MVDDESRLSTVWLLYMFALNIIDFHLVASTVLRIVGGESAGFLKDPVGKFFALRLYNDVGTGSPFGVEPPVASVSKVEGQFFVLEVVFPYIDMIAVTGQIVEGAAF